MKIPIQDKIAELERRIAALEARSTVVLSSSKGEQRVEQSPEFWNHFDSVFASMDRMFKAIRWR